MTQKEGSKGFMARLADAPWFEGFLAAMVAVYGILVAGAAYNASIFGGDSSQQYSYGLAYLAQASSEYALADQYYAADVNALTQFLIELYSGDPETTEAVQDVILNNLSEQAFGSVDRVITEQGEESLEDLDIYALLDDQYYDELYGYPDELWSTANAAFAVGDALDNLGDAYELLVLYLATGLGFAAWASLIDKEKVSRYVFAIMAVILLAWSIVQGLGLISEEVPVKIPAPAETSDEALE